MEGLITVGKSKTQGGEGRLVYLSALAVQTLKEWRSPFPTSLPSHAVFPREACGLKGKKGTFGGEVMPYKTFPDQPVRSFATAWRGAKKAAPLARSTAQRRVSHGRWPRYGPNPPGRSLDG